MISQNNSNSKMVWRGPEATSSYVTVLQDGRLDADGDGITALSNAAAAAVVTQNASQSNSNIADATSTTSGNVTQTQGLVLQINTNEQNGIAISSAQSGPVTVISINDPAGGDGINATSSATSDSSRQSNCHAEQQQQRHNHSAAVGGGQMLSQVRATRNGKAPARTKSLSCSSM